MNLSKLSDEEGKLEKYFEELVSKQGYKKFMFMDPRLKPFAYEYRLKKKLNPDEKPEIPYYTEELEEKRDETDRVYIPVIAYAMSMDIADLRELAKNNKDILFVYNTTISSYEFKAGSFKSNLIALPVDNDISTSELSCDFIEGEAESVKDKLEKIRQQIIDNVKVKEIKAETQTTGKVDLEALGQKYKYSAVVYISNEAGDFEQLSSSQKQGISRDILECAQTMLNGISTQKVIVFQPKKKDELKEYMKNYKSLIRELEYIFMNNQLGIPREDIDLIFKEYYRIYRLVHNRNINIGRDIYNKKTFKFRM